MACNDDISQCNICLESMNVINTCSCSHVAHKKCIETWHNIEYGKIIQIGRLCCPQCKAPAKSEYIQNKEILRTMTDNPGWTYILCPSCKKLKQYYRESCINRIETMYRLICEDCSYKTIKSCPKCNVMIQKENGCSHIMCTACNTHFCWICKKICSLATIYDHIDSHSNIPDYDIEYLYYYNRIMMKYISIQDIPSIFLTEDIIKLALETSDKTIKYIEQTKEMCMYAVEEYGTALQYIEKPNKDIILAAIENDGVALKFIKNKTEEICMIAVKSNGLALQFVNRNCANYYNLSLTAVKENGNALKYFKHTKSHSKKQKYSHIIIYNIYSIAVRENGLALRYVHVYILSKNNYYRICLSAVKKDGYALQYVHVDYLSQKNYYQICITAVRHDGMSLQFCKIQNKILCVIAILQNPFALQFVENKDIILQLITVVRNINIICYIIKNTRKIMIFSLNFFIGVFITSIFWTILIYFLN